MSSGTKRPIGEVLAVAEALLEQLRPACERIEICGSLRRRARLVSDIELVAIPKIEPFTRPIPDSLFGMETVQVNRLWDLLDRMLGSEYIRAGEKYRAFICPQETVKVDLFTAEAGNWGLIQLIRTGSAEFSKHVVTRLRAARRPSFEGWIRQAPEFGPPTWGDLELAEFPKIPTTTEERVFELARVPYREPHQRGE